MRRRLVALVSALTLAATGIGLGLGFLLPDTARSVVITATDVKCIGNGVNETDCSYVLTGSNQVYHSWFNGGWHLEGAGNAVGVAGGPLQACIARGPNAPINIFTIGTNGDVWWTWWQNGWAGWYDIGGNARGKALSCAYDQVANVVQVYEVDGGNVVNEDYLYYGPGWSGWFPIQF